MVLVRAADLFGWGSVGVLSQKLAPPLSILDAFRAEDGPRGVLKRKCVSFAQPSLQLYALEKREDLPLL